MKKSKTLLGTVLLATAFFAAHTRAEVFGNIARTTEVYTAAESDTEFKDKVNLISFGDSYTLGPIAALSYVYYLGQYNPNWTVYNNGVSGNTMQQIYDRRADMLAQIDPDPLARNVLTIMGGANDYISLSSSFDDVYNLIGSLTDYGLANGIDQVFVIQQSSLHGDPYEGRLEWSYKLAEHIEKNTNNYHYSVIDPTPIITDFNALPLDEYCANFPTDCHPNTNAHQVIARVIDQHLEGPTVTQQVNFGGDKRKQRYSSEATASIEPAGLSAYYSANFDTGNALVDNWGSSDVAHSLVWTNDASGTYLRFDGVSNSQIITVPWTPTIDQDWTVNVWVKTDVDFINGDLSNYGIVFGLWRSFGVRVVDMGINYDSRPYTDSIYANGTNVPTQASLYTVKSFPKNSEWHMYTVTFNHDAGRLTFYVDGYVWASHINPDLLGLDKPDGLYLGGAYPSSSGNFFEGGMKNICVFERELSTDEVNQFFYNGSRIEGLTRD